MSTFAETELVKHVVRRLLDYIERAGRKTEELIRKISEDGTAEALEWHAQPAMVCGVCRNEASRVLAELTKVVPEDQEEYLGRIFRRWAEEIIFQARNCSASSSNPLANMKKLALMEVRAMFLEELAMAGFPIMKALKEDYDPYKEIREKIAKVGSLEEAIKLIPEAPRPIRRHETKA